MGMSNIESYIAEQNQFRQQRANSLTLENSWLALAGLYWLEEGQNSLGSGSENRVVLPRGPHSLGSIFIESGIISLQTHIPVEIEGKQVTQCFLQSDKEGTPTRVNHDGLSFIVIYRGDTYALRLWDNQSPQRHAFAGLEWFELSNDFRIQARFVADPKVLHIGLSSGDDLVENNQSPGYVVFELNGQEHRLVAESKDPKKSLFFNFKDRTNGDTTYGAGRFLYTSGVEEGRVVLDFNRATNPYCAYTNYATCPLPPVENRLSIPILAGEKIYRPS